MYVGDGKLASTLKNRATATYKSWKTALAVASAVIVFSCMLLAPYIRKTVDETEL